MADGSLTKSFTKSEIVNLIYPVGAVYISLSSTSPATLFGGTWEKISGRFLLATGTCAANSDSYFGSIKAPNTWNPGLGSTGGEDYHTLTTSEMPQHSHQIPYGYGTAGNGTGNSYYTYLYGGTDTWTHQTGSGTRHNNMPPYLAVNMWKRTA